MNFSRIPDTVLLFIVLMVLAVIYTAFKFTSIEDNLIRDLLLGTTTALIAMLTSRRGTRQSDTKIEVEHVDTVNTGADIKE